MTRTNTSDNLIETISEAGFWPTDDLLDLEAMNINERQAGILDYFAKRGWGAARLEGDPIQAWATLVRWDDDIKIMTIDANGVITAEARFDLNPQGLRWLAAALDA